MGPAAWWWPRSPAWAERLFSGQAFRGVPRAVPPLAGGLFLGCPLCLRSALLGFGTGFGNGLGTVRNAFGTVLFWQGVPPRPGGACGFSRLTYALFAHTPRLGRNGGNAFRLSFGKQEGKRGRRDCRLAPLACLPWLRWPCSGKVGPQGVPPFRPRPGVRCFPRCQQPRRPALPPETTPHRCLAATTPLFGLPP